MMKKAGISILLTVGIVVFVNLISEQYFFRIDLTEDGQYTLSSATRNMLKNLDEPVTVKAYFSEELPPNIAKTRKDFEEFLIEYGRLSDGNIVYEFVNPNENEELEREAIQAGVQPVMINMREKNQMKQQKAFLGAVLQLGEQKEFIPFLQPSSPLEYTLSTAIKKMAVLDKPSVALLQGHGEPGIDEMSEVNAGLSVLYNLEPYSIENSVIPDKYKTLVIVRPADTIPAEDLAALDAFLARGGNLMVAINCVDGDFQTSMGSVVHTGLEDWLASRGLTFDPNFVVDGNCASVRVQQQQGAFRFASNVNFPFIPIITKFADHPATKGLEAVVMQFASPLRYTGDTSSTFTATAFTSELSGSLKAPQYFNIQKRWTENDLPLKNQAVAGILERREANGIRSRIYAIGDGDFPINGPRGQSQQLQPDNVNMMVNGVDWLSDDTGLIELRTKGIRYRPLDEVEEATQAVLKYLNFLLPIILVVLGGLVRMQMNNNKRIRRMQENYG